MSKILLKLIKSIKNGIEITDKVRYAEDKSISARWVEVPGPRGNYTGELQLEITTLKGVYRVCDWDSCKFTGSFNSGDILVSLTVDYDRNIVLSW